VVHAQANSVHVHTDTQILKHIRISCKQVPEKPAQEVTSNSVNSTPVLCRCPAHCLCSVMMATLTYPSCLVCSVALISNCVGIYITMSWSRTYVKSCLVSGCKSAICIDGLLSADVDF